MSWILPRIEQLSQKKLKTARPGSKLNQQRLAELVPYRTKQSKEDTFTML